MRDGAFEARFGRLMHGDAGDVYPVARKLPGDVLLVGVSSAHATGLLDSSGWAGEEQLRRLDVLLGRAALDGQAVVVALHYGLRLPNGRPDGRTHGLRDAEALIAVLQRHRVALAVHGHIHRRYVHPDGVGTGVAMANPGSLTDARYDRAYHIYELSRQGEALRIRVRARLYRPEGFSEEARDLEIALPVPVAD